MSGKHFVVSLISNIKILRDNKNTHDFCDQMIFFYFKEICGFAMLYHIFF